MEWRSEVSAQRFPGHRPHAEEGQQRVEAEPLEAGRVSLDEAPQGYKDFEVSQLPPKVDVCERRYLINVNFLNGGPTDPAAACPKYERLPVEAIPKAPMYQEARSNAPIQSKIKRQASAPASTAASQATIGGGSTFGFAPAKPSVAGFAFRTNSRLSR